ncbi:MAG TPA: DUF433 domain-containing protein [Thermomicrobiales bacterium]|jgi:uncharacterized protein (DUF433 family)
MTGTAALQPAIIRTERGLTVAGTRVTLYDLLEYLADGWAHAELYAVFGLSSAQFASALHYIEEHREAVEAEYHDVVQQAEDSRHYWEERNRERLAQIADSVGYKQL